MSNMPNSTTNQQYNPQLTARVRKFGPVHFESKKILLAVLYFFMISLLWNIYRVSTYYAYDLGRIVPNVFEIFSPLGHGFLYFYLAPITAILTRFLSLGKSILLSIACIFLWLVYLYFNLNSESFGYIFLGLHIILGYLFAGLLVGYFSRYFHD